MKKIAVFGNGDITVNFFEDEDLIEIYVNDSEGLDEDYEPIPRNIDWSLVEYVHSLFEGYGYSMIDSYASYEA